MREKMMAKFAEDDRIELMNAQKRSMKQLQHKRDVEQVTFRLFESFSVVYFCSFCPIEDRDWQMSGNERLPKLPRRSEMRNTWPS